LTDRRLFLLSPIVMIPFFLETSPRNPDTVLWISAVFVLSVLVGSAAPPHRPRAFYLNSLSYPYLFSRFPPCHCLWPKKCESIREVSIADWYEKQSQMRWSVQLLVNYA
jgi:hypothetical protein